VRRPQDPGADAAAVRVEPRDAAPQGQERLLHDILRHRTPPAHAIGERERRIGVPVEHHGERPRIAFVLDALHELLVREAPEGSWTCAACVGKH
jgi:hypothetical protein